MYAQGIPSVDLFVDLLRNYVIGSCPKKDRDKHETEFNQQIEIIHHMQRDVENPRL